MKNIFKLNSCTPIQGITELRLDIAVSFLNLNWLKIVFENDDRAYRVSLGSSVRSRFSFFGTREKKNSLYVSRAFRATLLRFIIPCVVRFYYCTCLDFNICQPCVDFPRFFTLRMRVSSIISFLLAFKHTHTNTYTHSLTLAFLSSSRLINRYRKICRFRIFERLRTAPESFSTRPSDERTKRSSLF